MHVVDRMYGLFQTTFYFGYMALFSLALGIMCGEYLLLSCFCMFITKVVNARIKILTLFACLLFVTCHGRSCLSACLTALLHL